MPSPDRNAGGEPGDWDNKGGCKNLFGLMLVIGFVSVAQLLGIVNLAVNGI